MCYYYGDQIGLRLLQQDPEKNMLQQVQKKEPAVSRSRKELNATNEGTKDGKRQNQENIAGILKNIVVSRSNIA